MGGDNESMKPTLVSQSMVGMTTSILAREGTKTNEYRSGTSSQSRDINT